MEILALPLALLSLAALVTAVVAHQRISTLELEWRRRAGDTPGAAPRPGPAAPPPLPPQHSGPALAGSVPPAPPAVPLPPARPPAPPAAPAAPKRPIEEWVGVALAALVGIAAVVMGIAYGIAYAVQQNWLGPHVRLAGGFLAGVALLLAGRHCDRSRHGLAMLARVLTGGGVAVLYFNCHAARDFYGLVSAPVEFMGLLVVSLLCGSLALHYESSVLAVVGVCGAFAAPLLTGEGHSPDPLLPYAAALNFGVLALAAKRPAWQAPAHAAFVGTVALVGVWLAGADGGATGIGLLWLAVFFACFAALPLLRPVDAEESAAGATLRTGLASLAYVVALHRTGLGREVFGGMATQYALAALLHAGFAAAQVRRAGALRSEGLVLVGGAALCLAVAAAEQWHGHARVTAWAGEGLILALAALRLRLRPLAWMGVALCLAAQLSAFDIPRAGFAAPLCNAWFGAHVLAAAASLAAGAGLWRRGGAMAVPGRVLLLAAAAGLWAAGTQDVERLSSGGTRVLQMAVFWVGLGTVLRVVGRWVDEPWTRVSGGAVAALALLRVASPDTWRGEPRPGLWHVGYLARMAVIAAAALGSCLHASGRVRALRTAFRLLAVAAALLLTTHTLRVMPAAWTRPAITVLWAATGVALAFGGLVLGRPPWRYAGLAALAVAVGKVFLVDLAALGGLARVGACLGVGALLLALSYLYRRIAPRPDAGEAAEPAD